MKSFVFTSLRKNSGKTSVIIGLSESFKGKVGYLKPFGDRLMYKKKHLWDYDSAVVSKLYALGVSPELMSMGFDHSKLRYSYDIETVKAKLEEMIDLVMKDRDYLFIESGSDIAQGISAHLDALSIARYLKATLIIIVSGNNDRILDDITYFKINADLTGISEIGIVINKVKDIEDFKMSFEDSLSELDLNILGILPFQPELTHPSVELISEVLFAKVISGEENLNVLIREVFVGAMSGDAAQRIDKFKKKNKLIITSGDRSDMILAALNTDCAGIVLTNNILPPPNIIAYATEKNVPLLLVQSDTLRTAKKIDQTVPLIGPMDTPKIKLCTSMIRDYSNLGEL
jgi:BioD-like phosphotransacetylase family protein